MRRKEHTFLARAFYPKTPLSTCDVINNTRVAAVIADDTGHTYSVKKTYWVDVSTYNKAVQIIKAKSKSVSANTLKYNIVDYNCTAFVEDVVNDLGLKTGMERHNWVIPKKIKDKYGWYLKDILPKLEKRNGYYPGAAGEQIK